MKLVHLVLATVIGLSKSDRSDLIERAVSIANDAYKPFLLTTVAWWDYDHQHVNDFLMKFKGTVTTTKVKECVAGCRKIFTVTQAVFFAAMPEEFDNFLAVSGNVTSVPMLVILIIINDNYTNDLIKYNEIAFKRGVVDMVAVRKKNDGTISISTLIPYGSGICGDFSPIDVTMNQANIFKENKYKNFHECPIRVTVVEVMPYVKLIKENDTVIDIGGIDGRLLKFIIERLNATMDITSVSSHEDLGYYLNGTANGSFGDLYYNIADVMVPALIMTTRRYPAAQITSIYRQSYIILCLPKRAEIYKLLKILLPFYNLATPMIIASAVCIYYTLRIIKKIGKQECHLPQGTVFGIYSLFFGHYYNINSRYWLINSLFVSWIWFSLVFRISYEGRLVEGLHRIILEPPVRTYRQAIKAVKEVRVHTTLLQFYRNTSIEKYGVVIKLSELIPSLYEIENGNKILLAIDKGQAKYHKKNVQVLENKIITSPACLFLRPRFPSAEYISHVILRITETGQVEKIMKDFSTGWKLHHFNKTITLHVEPLGMNILGSCFLALLAMHVVCFLIFGAEVFHNYYITRSSFRPLPFTL